MKYLRRELNQVEKEYLKQFGQDSLNRVVLHDPNTKDKQEVQDTIDILKDAMAKNKPLEQVPEDMWKLIEFQRMSHLFLTYSSIKIKGTLLIE